MQNKIKKLKQSLANAREYSKTLYDNRENCFKEHNQELWSENSKCENEIKTYKKAIDCEFRTRSALVNAVYEKDKLNNPPQAKYMLELNGTKETMEARWDAIQCKRGFEQWVNQNKNCLKKNEPAEEKFKACRDAREMFGIFSSECKMLEEKAKEAVYRQYNHRHHK